MKPSLASSITKIASKQTYYTIRFLVDRDRVDDAFKAYAYFRWLDDILDDDSSSKSDRRALIEQEKYLLESCYRGERPRDVNRKEEMLVELVQGDHEKNSGLQSYLRNMMQVLDFDARRLGRLISYIELNEYTRWLATAVTEAMHYFIGHSQPTSKNEGRYLAVTGAHITHMLRDTLEDIQAGYFNIPAEYLTANGIGPHDVESQPYLVWIKERVNLARAYFKYGKYNLARDENVRRRIAGYAYIARFEVVLDALERVGYKLTPGYPKDHGLGAGMRLSGSVLAPALFPQAHK